MISHDAKVCRRSSPGEVFDLGHLECRVEPVLDVFDRLPGFAACRVGEYVGAIRPTFGIERLQCRQHRRIQGNRMGPAALGPRNANDAVQEVHVVPPRGEEAASARPVCTERMIFSARHGDVSIVFAASMSRLYSSSVR